MRPLVNGLSIYKKFNNNSMTGKIFDTATSDVNPPESCGYAFRLFKINCNEETLEVKNPKNKHVEARIPLAQLKGIMLGSSTKSFIKQKRNSTSRANQEIGKLIINEYIPFMLLFTDGKLDVIAHNYTIFKSIEGALEEIIKNRKGLSSILKNCD